MEERIDGAYRVLRSGTVSLRVASFREKWIVRCPNLVRLCELAIALSLPPNLSEFNALVRAPRVPMFGSFSPSLWVVESSRSNFAFFCWTVVPHIQGGVAVLSHYRRLIQGIGERER